MLLTDVDVPHGLDEQLDDGDGSEGHIPFVQSNSASVEDDQGLLLIASKVIPGALSDTIGHKCRWQEHKDNHTEERDLVRDLREQLLGPL